MNEKMTFPSQEKEQLQYNRMPITIELEGNLVNIWAKYTLGREMIIADCTRCGEKQKELEIQKPENIVIETDDPKVKEFVESKLRQLIRTVEERMSVCKDCFDDDFISKRADLYIKILREVQEEMGIKIDYGKQEEKILSSLNDTV